MSSWLYRRTRRKYRSTTKKRATAAANKANAVNEIERMFAAITRPTEEEREVFVGMWSDAQCEARGANSRAKDVLADIERSLAGVDAIVKKHAAAMRYGELRLGFLLGCVRQLAAVVARQENARKHRATHRKEIERYSEAGVAIRKDLRAVLDELAGPGASEERERLDTAYGKANTIDNLVTALHALAALVERWLAREDVTARSLVRAYELTQNDADRARRVAVDLKRLRDDAVEDAEWPQKDSPTTDRVEGRVLFEMEVLDRAVQRLRAKDRTIADLKFGAALRRALRGAPAKDEVVDMTGVAADDPGAADAANDTAARPVSQPVPVSAAS